MSQPSTIRSDEEVIFFPTNCSPIDKSNWRVHVHGWIFEPEVESRRRNLLFNSLCRSLSLSDADCEQAIFKERAWPFIVDNERDKRIGFTLGGKAHTSNPSGPEGHFHAEVIVSATDIEPILAASANADSNRDSSSWLEVVAPDTSGKGRKFRGAIQPIAESGISVVSDVDDTIKISNVSDKAELLRNSFLRPFTEVGGMPALYQEIASGGTQFHYLSASPWQLYAAISNFAISAGFPRGSYHMKEFRWKGSRFFDLFIAPEKFKTPILEDLLKAAPKRRFVLIGDSGERDPEIYGDLARAHPETSFRIIIREVPEVPMTETRRANAFKTLGADTWRVITDSELMSPNARQAISSFALSEGTL